MSSTEDEGVISLSLTNKKELILKKEFKTEIFLKLQFY